MKAMAWSAVLQWSRVAMNAAVFLVAARYLTLLEIGAFATAFAPVQIIQAMQKSGSADIGVLAAKAPARLNTLAFFSFASGFGCAALLLTLSFLMPAPVSSMMRTLSVIPLLNGLAFPSEATLRRGFRMRALALRTMVSQVLAAGVALWLFEIGLGIWCLVSFVLANSTINAILSIALGRIWPRCLPTRKQLKVELPMIGYVAMRDLAHTSTLPILQFFLGLCLGLPAAGVFQIAARLLALIDAIAISPVRFLALPKLADAVISDNLARHTLTILRQTAGVAFLVYPSAIIAGPSLLLVLIGDVNGKTAGELLPVFCLFGLMNAIAMPLNQALVATGQARLTLVRALSTLALSLVFALPGLTVSAQLVSAGLPMATGVVLVFFVHKARQQLAISLPQLGAAIAAPCLCGAIAVLAMVVANGFMPSLTPIAALAADILAVPAIYAGLMTLAHFHMRAVPG